MLQDYVLTRKMTQTNSYKITKSLRNILNLCYTKSNYIWKTHLSLLRCVTLERSSSAPCQEMASGMRVREKFSPGSWLKTSPTALQILLGNTPANVKANPVGLKSKETSFGSHLLSTDKNSHRDWRNRSSQLGSKKKYTENLTTNPTLAF